MESGYYWVVVFAQDGWVVLQYEAETDLFYSYMGIASFEPSEIFEIGNRITTPPK
jgi:hypothetical protein